MSTPITSTTTRWITEILPRNSRWPDLSRFPGTGNHAMASVTDSVSRAPGQTTPHFSSSWMRKTMVRSKTSPLRCSCANSSSLARPRSAFMERLGWKQPEVRLVEFGETAEVPHTEARTYSGDGVFRRRAVYGGPDFIKATQHDVAMRAHPEILIENVAQGTLGNARSLVQVFGLQSGVVDRAQQLEHPVQDAHTTRVESPCMCCGCHRRQRPKYRLENLGAGGAFSDRRVQAMWKTFLHLEHSARQRKQTFGRSTQWQSKAAFQQSEVEFIFMGTDPLHYDIDRHRDVQPSHRVLCTGVKHLVGHDPGNLTRIDIGAVNGNSLAIAESWN